MLYMITILYIKYIKDVLAENEWAPTLQSLVLVAFFIFFLVTIIMVLTKPKEYYKEVSEVPLENDSSISALD